MRVTPGMRLGSYEILATPELVVSSHDATRAALTHQGTTVATMPSKSPEQHDLVRASVRPSAGRWAC